MVKLTIMIIFNSRNLKEIMFIQPIDKNTIHYRDIASIRYKVNISVRAWITNSL